MPYFVFLEMVKAVAGASVIILAPQHIPTPAELAAINNTLGRNLVSPSVFVPYDHTISLEVTKMREYSNQKIYQILIINFN